MEINEEFKSKMERKAAELMRKSKKLVELTKGEKDAVSIRFVQSLIELQTSHQNGTAVALKMIPTKEVADAYTKAQVFCFDFIDTVIDGMIKTVENHNKNNKNKKNNENKKQ